MLETAVFVSHVVAELKQAVREYFRIRLEAGHASFTLILALLVLGMSASPEYNVVSTYERLPVIVDDQCPN